MDCFRQAIDRDPAYALAYSGLADAYSLASTGYYGELPVAESIANALPAALKALELAPTLAEAHASLGTRPPQPGRLCSRRTRAGAGHRTEPGLHDGSRLAWPDADLAGPVSRGRCEHAHAFLLDPLSPIINANVGFDALRFGDEAEAEARFAAAIEIDPAFQVPYSGMTRLNVRPRLYRGGAALDRAGDRARTGPGVLSRTQGADPCATRPYRRGHRDRRVRLLQSDRKSLRSRPGRWTARSQR